MRLYIDKCNFDSGFTNHDLIENRLKLQVYENEYGHYIDETDLLSILDDVVENIESVLFINILNKLGIHLQLSWEYDKTIWHDYDNNYFNW